MSKGFEKKNEKKKASSDEFRNMPDKLLLEPLKGSAAANAGNNGYTIYEVPLAALMKTLGKKVYDFLDGLHANPAQYDENSEWGYCKGEHGNDHRNLPSFPPAGGQYIEYFVDNTGNTMAKKGNLRFIRDTLNDRIYVSVTHYDAWTDSDKKTKRNGFYLVKF